jgi:hypothetical protein
MEQTQAFSQQHHLLRFGLMVVVLEEEMVPPTLEMVDPVALVVVVVVVPLVPDQNQVVLEQQDKEVMEVREATADTGVLVVVVQVVLVLPLSGRTQHLQ